MQISLRARPPPVDIPGGFDALRPLEERVYCLIENTPPAGEDFARTVRNLLHRECHWLSWKATSCPPFEKSPTEGEIGLFEQRKPNGTLEESRNKLVEDGPSDGPRKRKRLEKPGTNTSKPNGVRSSTAVGTVDIVSLPLSELGAQLDAQVPPYDTQIAPYEDAMDPASGIEEEYHPKNDKVRSCSYHETIIDHHSS